MSHLVLDVGVCTLHGIDILYHRRAKKTNLQKRFSEKSEQKVERTPTRRIPARTTSNLRPYLW